MNSLNILALEFFQKGGNAGGTGGVLMMLAIMVTLIGGAWKAYAKAGQPGWAVIVPIYNTYIMLKIAGRPGWWLLLMLIPLVNLVVGVIALIDFAKSYGKGVGFAMGILFLSPIFLPILGFGPAEYVGPAAAEH